MLFKRAQSVRLVDNGVDAYIKEGRPIPRGSRVVSVATAISRASGRSNPMIIDAWMQHPNAEWILNPMFDSLRPWKPGKWSETSQPIDATLAEMDQAGVSTGSVRGTGRQGR
jgi:hypothetical protein